MILSRITADRGQGARIDGRIFPVGAKPGDDRGRGFVVAFSFSSDAQAECAAFHKKTGRIIKLITVQNILDGEHVQKV